MTDPDSKFCGYSCSDAKNRQQELIDELIDFSKYNPEYSIVMLGKLIEMLYEARNDLIKMKPQPEPVL